MWIEEHLPEPRRAITIGVGAASPLWPTFMLAAGAGVAFWWWTQWARGDAGTANAAASQAAEAPSPQPSTATSAEPVEEIMAHVPEPAGAPSTVAEPAAADLVEPAEEILAHVPPAPEAAPEVVTASEPEVKAASRTKASRRESELLGSASPLAETGGSVEEAVVPPELGLAAKPKARKPKPGEARA